MLTFIHALLTFILLVPITALGAFIISLIFIFYFIIFSALILLITQGATVNADITDGIAIVLSIIATAIYTGIGLKKLERKLGVC